MMQMIINNNNTERVGGLLGISVGQNVGFGVGWKVGPTEGWVGLYVVGPRVGVSVSDSTPEKSIAYII